MKGPDSDFNYCGPEEGQLYHKKDFCLDYFVLLIIFYTFTWYVVDVDENMLKTFNIHMFEN